MKPSPILLAAGLLLAGPAALAAEPAAPAARPAAKPAAAAAPAAPRPAATQAAARPAAAVKPTAKAPPRRPAAPPPVEPETLELSPAQLAAAERVHTGRADCEFDRSVEVDPLPGRPGHFDVRLGARRFLMVPQDTSTGAVRLHDRKADVVWLQIPSKSMMMDNRLGQRLVDACLHPAQREPATTPTQVAEREAAPAAEAQALPVAETPPLPSAETPR